MEFWLRRSAFWGPLPYSNYYAELPGRCSLSSWWYLCRATTWIWIRGQSLGWCYFNEWVKGLIAQPSSVLISIGIKVSYILISASWSLLELTISVNDLYRSESVFQAHIGTNESQPNCFEKVQNITGTLYLQLRTIRFRRIHSLVSFEQPVSSCHHSVIVRALELKWSVEPIWFIRLIKSL